MADDCGLEAAGGFEELDFVGVVEGSCLKVALAAAGLALGDGAAGFLLPGPLEFGVAEEADAGLEMGRDEEEEEEEALVDGVVCVFVDVGGLDDFGVVAVLLLAEDVLGVLDVDLVVVLLDALLVLVLLDAALCVVLVLLVDLLAEDDDDSFSDELLVLAVVLPGLLEVSAHEKETKILKINLNKKVFKIQANLKILCFIYILEF